MVSGYFNVLVIVCVNVAAENAVVVVVIVVVGRVLVGGGSLGGRRLIVWFELLIIIIVQVCFFRSKGRRPGARARGRVAATACVVVVVHYLGGRQRVLRLPGVDKASSVAKGVSVETALRRHALQRTVCASERVLAPVMRAKGRAARTPLVGAGLVQRSAEPSKGELVLRRRLLHLLGVRRHALVKVSLVHLLAVHVRVRLHGAALQRPVHAQRQVPRVDKVFRVHGVQRRREHAAAEDRR